MQMELAHHDGVLITGAEGRAGRPKQPDELLAADRGGLVFVPRLGFTANVAELRFCQPVSKHHVSFQYLSRNG